MAPAARGASGPRPDRARRASWSIRPEAVTMRPRHNVPVLVSHPARLLRALAPTAFFLPVRLPRLEFAHVRGPVRRWSITFDYCDFSRRPWVGRAPFACDCGRRLHHADSHPGTGHPTRAGRRRPACGRPDRHWQDGRLRAADPEPTHGHPTHAARRRPPACAHPDTDPRTHRAGRGIRADLRPSYPYFIDGDVRRRQHQSADQRAATPARHPGGHARPPARPLRPADCRSLRRRDPRARRGRSHA